MTVKLAPWVSKLQQAQVVRQVDGKPCISRVNLGGPATFIINFIAEGNRKLDGCSQFGKLPSIVYYINDGSVLRLHFDTSI